MECPVEHFPHLTTLDSSLPVEYPHKVTGQAISGKVPEWIKGTWFRNGPGMLHFKEESVNHWFDGMALVRKYEINDGKITYMSRLLKGDSIQKNMAAGRVVVAELGTAAAEARGIFGRVKEIFTMPEFTDNCLINFLKLGDNLIAITESNYVRKVDADTLETQQKIDLSKSLPLNLMGSHPLVARDGSIFLISSTIFDKGHTKYNIIQFPPVNPGASADEAIAQSKVLCSIESTWRISPSYHHSFAMSDNFVVFVEMPMKMDIPKLAMAHLRKMSYSECIELLPKEKTNIFLIDKRTGAKYPTSFTCDPFVAWHHVNAYEDRGHVILDLCCYDDNCFYEKYFMENLAMGPTDFAEKFSMEPVSVNRLVLPLVDATGGGNLITLPDTTCTATRGKNDHVIHVKSERLATGTEVPCINPAFQGRRYHFYYSSGGFRLPPGEELVKISVTDKRVVHRWTEKSCWLGEPLFIARPGSCDEDDGVVVAMVNVENGKPFMLMLDAKTFAEICRVEFDANIPPDLHGIYVPTQE